MHVTRRQTCRVCGSRALRPVIDLGRQHLQGGFTKPDGRAATRKLSMELVQCSPLRDENACGLLQARYTVPPEMMYRHYWYRSGMNDTMRTHLQQLVFAARKFIDGAVSVDVEGDARPKRVLDIGCNDGTLLGYYPESWDCWGVDPSDVAATVDQHDKLHIINDFFPSLAVDQALRSVSQQPGRPTQTPGQDILSDSGKPFDIITAVAMFYDLEDPVGFVQSVSSWLAADGVFIFEVSYLPAMLRQQSYDTICHEHIEYYSLAALEAIMARAGMRIVHVEENAINGGSIRCFAVQAASATSTGRTVHDMRAAEFDLRLDSAAPYLEFQKRAEILKTDLRALLRKIKADGKRIHAYGASTKGNTILQWCGIDTRLIDCAADRNKAKWGTRTPGSEIPVVSEEESRALRPDFYLVLPWSFRKEFLEREHATLVAGTRFIFPLPKLEVVGG
jgi:SAM-dependent methyltransferase